MTTTAILAFSPSVIPDLIRDPVSLLFVFVVRLLSVIPDLIGDPEFLSFAILPAPPGVAAPRSREFYLGARTV